LIVVVSRYFIFDCREFGGESEDYRQVMRLIQAQEMRRGQPPSSIVSTSTTTRRRGRSGSRGEPVVNGEAVEQEEEEGKSKFMESVSEVTSGLRKKLGGLAQKFNTARTTSSQAQSRSTNQGGDSEDEEDEGISLLKQVSQV